MDSNYQLKLFTTGELKSLTGFGVRQGNELQMDSDYLQQWKARIQKYQFQFLVTLLVATRVDSGIELEFNSVCIISQA